MNYSFFIGNLTKDPEFEKVKDYSKCQFTIAVNRRRVNKDGVREADFIPITVWRQLADNCHKYLHKGSRVSVVAHVQVDHYQGSDGNNKVVYRFIADDVEFQPSGDKHGGGNGNNAGGVPAYESTASQVPQGFTEVDEEELPF